MSQTKRFKLECIERARSNYGSDVFDVIFTEPLTVAEFIQDVISDEREWGNITIGLWFNGPRCTYSRGKITAPMPEEYLNKKIISADSIGGWSNMSYRIFVED